MWVNISSHTLQITQLSNWAKKNWKGQSQARCLHENFARAAKPELIWYLLYLKFSLNLEDKILLILLELLEDTDWIYSEYVLFRVCVSRWSNMTLMDPNGIVWPQVHCHFLYQWVVYIYQRAERVQQISPLCLISYNNHRMFDLYIKQKYLIWK